MSTSLRPTCGRDLFESHVKEFAEFFVDMDLSPKAILKYWDSLKREDKMKYTTEAEQIRVEFDRNFPYRESPAMRCYDHTSPVHQYTPNTSKPDNGVHRNDPLHKYLFGSESSSKENQQPYPPGVIYATTAQNMTKQCSEAKYNQNTNSNRSNTNFFERKSIDSTPSSQQPFR